MSEAGGTRLDRIARELASGEVSRRSALKRLTGAAVAAAVPGALLAEPALGSRRRKCPKSRRCKGKCCPKNARCKKGKCKCKAGYKKCGKKCVDTNTNPNHCGACGNACPEGYACVGGDCQQIAVCGDEQIQVGEECDGNDLGGESCESLDMGFIGGTLACASDCTFDTSGCTGCPGEGNPCTAGTGACQNSGVIVCDQEGNSICSAEPGTPGPELCNGIDDNCNGIVDDDPIDTGGACECTPGVGGVVVCVGGQLQCVC